MSAHQLIGTVTRIASLKTATVTIARHVEHPILRKRIHRVTNYLVHDPQQRAQLDDLVRIIPKKASAKKNFTLDTVIRRRGKAFSDNATVAD